MRNGMQRHQVYQNQMNQISFAHQCSRYASKTFTEDPSSIIQCQQSIQSVSHQPNIQSPIHNLHLKYLPSAYRALQFSNGPFQQRMKEEKIPCKEIGEIQKKISFILNEIDQQQKRGLQLLQRYPDKQKRHSGNQKREELTHKSALIERSSNINERSKTSDSKSIESSIFKTPQRYNNGRNFNKISSKDGINFQNMSQIRQQNQLSAPKGYYLNTYENFHRRYLRSNSVTSKYSRRSSLSASKELIVRGKNINQEIDKLQSKIKNINDIKDRLRINFVHQRQSYKAEEQSITKKRQPFAETQLTNITKKTSSQSFLKSQSNFSEWSQFAQSSINSCISDIPIKPIASQVTKGSHLLSSQDVGQPTIMKKLAAKKSKRVKRGGVQKTQYNDHQKQNRNKALKCQRISTQANEHDTFRAKSGRIVKNQRTFQIPCLSQQGQKELQLFIDNISVQIKLDSSLRKAKQWFNRLKDDNKWEQLQRLVYGIKEGRRQGKSRQQLIQEYSVSIEQENPFYNPCKSDFTLQQLVRCRSQSQIHWQRNIKNHYSFQALQAKLSEENIDLRKRGFISIQDLLRFLNSELDYFYKNRDVVLIYQRMKKSEKLLFADLKNILQK